jgi:predicted nucleic acid-binding protein
MSDVVLDSCVAAKWIIPEADSALARRLLTEVVTRGDRPVVLDLVLIEVGNVLWKRRRSGAVTSDEAEQLLGLFLQHPLRVEDSKPLLTSALRIAMKYNRAFYDALFVALVDALGVTGVTADELALSRRSRGLSRRHPLAPVAAEFAVLTIRIGGQGSGGLKLQILLWEATTPAEKI